MEIVYTAGDPGANSFESLAEFKSFIATRHPDPTPKGVTRTDFLAILEGNTLDDVLSVKLAAAASTICVSLVFNGVITFPAQSLCFPRTGLVDREGREVDPLTNPQEIKNCQSELGVLYFQGSETFAANVAQALGVKSVKASSVAVEFQDVASSVELTDRDIVLADPAMIYSRMPLSALAYIPADWYKRERVENLLGRRSRVYRIG